MLGWIEHKKEMKLILALNIRIYHEDTFSPCEDKLYFHVQFTTFWYAYKPTACQWKANSVDSGQISFYWPFETSDRDLHCLLCPVRPHTCT